MPAKEDTEKSKELAQLIRIHEANCAVKYENDHDVAFRYAIQKKIAVALGLPEVRDLTITGPGKGVARAASPR